jgi:CRISPR-associated protein Cas6
MSEEKRIMGPEPKIDLCFTILGQKLAVDHGFTVYAAVSRVVPLIHDDKDIGLKLIRGRYIGNGVLDISPHSELILRIPANHIGRYLSLAGKTLEVFDDKLNVGVPKSRALVPSPVVYAQLVTTRNAQEQPRFEAEVRSQMERLNLKGKVSIGKRRTFQIHGKQVVGYSLLLSELSAEDSISLQEHGLGGRRKMGCGFFEASRT